jgi:hypothetical protein
VDPDPVSAARQFGLGLRVLAGLAVLLGLGLWLLAIVNRRARRRRRDMPVLLIGGALALAGGAYLLWALP